MRRLRLSSMLADTASPTATPAATRPDAAGLSWAIAPDIVSRLHGFMQINEPAVLLLIPGKVLCACWPWRDPEYYLVAWVWRRV
jgi:hypothetical protein